MRSNWTLAEIRSIYETPFLQLLYQAATCHRQHHELGEIQLCQLVNIKRGGCAENCAYCAQSARNQTDVKAEALLPLSDLIEQAREAKRNGASRICMAAAWREVKDGPQFRRILEMVRAVKAMGLEVCCTLGMLTQEQANQLKEAGLYAYNHNLDTSEEYYPRIVTTRTYQDRLQTLERVRQAGLTVCCGGILGLGEGIDDRIRLLQTLSSFDPHPESVPINLLVRIKGTRSADNPPVTVWEVGRMIAAARLLMPETMIRLTAGRDQLTLAEQALCYAAGANSIFISDRLLTASNPTIQDDRQMLQTLGLKPRSLAKTPELTKRSRADFMEEALERRRQEGTHRQLSRPEELVDLTSNDYLGFARSVELIDAVQKDYQTLTAEGGIGPVIGSTGSRLLTGNSAFYEALEKQIAEFHWAEAGLLFNSGYLANLGLLSTIAAEEDQIILDSQVHASTWDGVRLSRATARVFGHNDMEQLRWQLSRARRSGGKIFVCVESLYSLSGDLAPLEEVANLCDEFGARLIVDEAHATGLLGPEGRGEVVARGLVERVFARVFTFGKALGTHGGIVVGSETLRDYLINFSRPLIYTTAFPLHTQVSIKCAYDRLLKAENERISLKRLVHYFRLSIQQTQLPVQTTDTPIQAILVRGHEAVRHAAAACADAGLDVRPILHPTVRRGFEQLRVCLHAFNTESEIDRLVAVFAGELREALTG